MINKDKMDQILRELHFMDENIDINDEKIQKIISSMLENNPQIENKTFKANLKKEILREIRFNKKKSFDFNIFKKIVYFGSGAVFSYAIFTITNPINPVDLIEKNLRMNTGILNLEENKTNLQQEKKEEKVALKSEKIISRDTINRVSTDDNRVSTDNNSIPTETKKDTEIIPKVLENISTNSENTRSLKQAKIPEISNLEDNISDSGINQDTSANLENTNSIASDSLGGMSLMMKSSIIPEFNKDDFIKSVEIFTTDLVYSLRASELSVENNILIIKTSSQTDFDIINTPENLELLKAKLLNLGFNYEIKILLK